MNNPKNAIAGSERDCVELAAAGLANAVGSLIEQLVEGSDRNKQQVAAAMGVSPARISQLLASDGNVRMATLGRLAYAAGARLSLTATDRQSGEGITVPRTPRRARPQRVRSVLPGLHESVASAVFEDTEQAASLAAAALINAIGSLMEQVVNHSGRLRKNVAAEMGVTAGRVTQIVEGDGNIRIATLGRILEVCGFDVVIKANFNGTGAQISVPRAAAGRARGSGGRSHDNVVDLAARRACVAAAQRSAGEVKERMKQLAPVKVLVERGIIPPGYDEGAQQALSDLLGIENLWSEPAFAAAARRHNASNPPTLHQKAWVACARKSARSLNVSTFQAARFRDLAAKLSQTVTDSSSFKSMPDRFAAVGVKLVCIAPFPGNKISGATFLDSSGTPVIALSGRGKRLDKVLFTLLHEAAHVALKHVADGSVRIDLEDVACLDEQESAADELAGKWILPEPLPSNTHFDRISIEEIAARQGVHPIIVVGRLQSQSLVPWGSALVRGAPNVDHEMATW